MAEEKKAFFTYKGVPLVRKGNNIYFGNMYDEFVVMIEILSTEKVDDREDFMYKLFGISTISQESIDYWDE